jgi:hypothetical protein
VVTAASRSAAARRAEKVFAAFLMKANMSDNPWKDLDGLAKMKAKLAEGGPPAGPPPVAPRQTGGPPPYRGQLQATQPEEIVYCYAKTTTGLQVVGMSKCIGFNMSCLEAWSTGNLRNWPNVSARDARRFFGAVLNANQKAREPRNPQLRNVLPPPFTGRRSAFHCAEVNAVTQLLGDGASLGQIRLYLPYQKSSAGNGYIANCPACQDWIAFLEIAVIDRI